MPLGYGSDVNAVNDFGPDGSLEELLLNQQDRTNK